MMLCPKCASSVPSPETTRFCAVCNVPFSNDLVLSRAQEKVAWEELETHGVVSAFVNTLRRCLMDPRDFFNTLSESGGSRSAWLYALIVGSIGSIFSFVWTYALIRPLLAYFPVLDDFGVDSAASTASLIFTPLIVSAKVGFFALYFQFLLFLFHRDRRGISATFKVVCYSQSAAIFNLIPVFGSIISPLWTLYLLARGFNKTHTMSMAKAFSIILLPLILGIAALVLFAALISAGFLFHDVLKDSLPLFR
jgi:hypothetical protein